jgi:hypothetical protein
VPVCSHEYHGCPWCRVRCDSSVRTGWIPAIARCASPGGPTPAANDDSRHRGGPGGKGYGGHDEASAASDCVCPVGSVMRAAPAGPGCPAVRSRAARLSAALPLAHQPPGSRLSPGSIRRNHDDVTLSWSGPPRCDIVVVRPGRRGPAAPGWRPPGTGRPVAFAMEMIFMYPRTRVISATGSSSVIEMFTFPGIQHARPVPRRSPTADGGSSSRPPCTARRRISRTTCQRDYRRTARTYRSSGRSPRASIRNPAAVGITFPFALRSSRTSCPPVGWTVIPARCTSPGRPVAGWWSGLGTGQAEAGWKRARYRREPLGLSTLKNYQQRAHGRT